MLFVREQRGKVWDEGRTKRAARDEIENEIGNAERGDIRLVFARSTELVADDDLAHKTEHATQDEKNHDQSRGLEDSTCVRLFHTAARKNYSMGIQRGASIRHCPT